TSSLINSPTPPLYEVERGPGGEVGFGGVGHSNQRSKRAGSRASERGAEPADRHHGGLSRGGTHRAFRPVGRGVSTKYGAVYCSATSLCTYCAGSGFGGRLLYY